MKYSWFLLLAIVASLTLPTVTRAEDIAVTINASNILWVSVNDAELTDGEYLTLSWTMPEGVRADFVTINAVAQMDGKTLVEPIVVNAVNTGTYSWKTPTNVNLAGVRFDVIANDLLDVAALGTSPAVTIGHPAEPVCETPVVDDAPVSDEGTEGDLVAPAIISLSDAPGRDYIYTSRNTRRAIADAAWVSSYDLPVAVRAASEVADIELEQHAALPVSGAVVTIDLLPGYYLVTADHKGERLMSISDRDAKSRLSDLGWDSALTVPYVNLWEGLIR